MQKMKANTVLLYFQPAPMSKFFQGYLGAVSSAVTIAVSTHITKTHVI